MKLIKAPSWHPFLLTTPEALRIAKRERRRGILRKWIRLPLAPF